MPQILRSPLTRAARQKRFRLVTSTSVLALTFMLVDAHAGDAPLRSQFTQRAQSAQRAQSLWPVDGWRSSPYHRAQNADGATIPCRCVFQGREYRVGEIVCMTTHVGVVLTRCDMSLNNTTWIPSDAPCDMSARQPSRVLAQR